ncbi:unnamed protein product [Prorocentrum cordatum]|uniref:Uncharacterized protein n=1 Tax=Prorocentrum cordatum TaxID=2364126 RepID=A0ABN9X4M1_9DINO|nr:unnamed protein product [Polarella glacialis]
MRSTLAGQAVAQDFGNDSASYVVKVLADMLGDRAHGPFPPVFEAIIVADCKSMRFALRHLIPCTVGRKDRHRRHFHQRSQMPVESFRRVLTNHMIADGATKEELKRRGQLT